MSRRLIELVVRARRFVTRTAKQPRRAAGRPRGTAGRQVGGEITQFSFRFALVIDLTYVGVGALGGVAVGRTAGPASPASDHAPLACIADSSTHTGVRTGALPNAPVPAVMMR